MFATEISPSPHLSRDKAFHDSGKLERRYRSEAFPGSQTGAGRNYVHRDGFSADGGPDFSISISQVRGLWLDDIGNAGYCERVGNRCDHDGSVSEQMICSLTFRGVDRAWHGRERPAQPERMISGIESAALVPGFNDNGRSAKGGDDSIPFRKRSLVGRRSGACFRKHESSLADDTM